MGLLAGCAQAAPPARHDVRFERIARLERIATGCGLPARTLTLKGKDQLHFQPPSDARYEDVDCVLTALKKTDMPVKMGFVGNETYETGNQQ
jgi:hypothetical protein